MQRHHVGIAVAVALLIAALAYFMMSREAAAPIPPADPEGGQDIAPVPADPDAVSGMRIGEYAVYAPDQKPGAQAVIPLAALGQPGFVAIHQMQGDAAGPVLGSSALLREGEHNNIAIALARTSNDGDMLAAALYIDNGDGVFALPADLPALDPMEAPVLMRFAIDADADPPPEIAI